MNVCPLGSYSPMTSAVIAFSVFPRGTTPPNDSVMAHLLGASAPSIDATRARGQPPTGSRRLPRGVVLAAYPNIRSRHHQPQRLESTGLSLLSVAGQSPSAT